MVTMQGTLNVEKYLTDIFYPIVVLHFDKDEEWWPVYMNDNAQLAQETSVVSQAGGYSDSTMASLQS